MSATNGEALVSAINRLLVRLDVRGVSANEIVACIKPLIADSEARACDQLRAARDECERQFQDKVQRLGKEVEVTNQLRAEVERLTAQRENLLKPMRDQATARAERAEAEVERLTKQAAFDGDHIHTLNAAFATRAEVMDATARAERAEAEIKDRAAMMRDVMRERDAAEAELAVERAIVSRIWVQLGSPTYAQLKGRSIYCLIDEMKAELAADRARLDWLLSRMAGLVLPANKCVAWTVDVYDYQNRFPSRAAIDAAMKEGAK